jgi:ADP-heptose:LPS heptosyltransferase
MPPPDSRRPWPRRADFRRWHNYGAAGLSEVVAEPLRRAARWWVGAPTTAPTTWRRGLILGPDHIGDVLFNTPSLPYLRAGLPGCEWTFLTSPAGADVLRGNPHLARVLIDERDGPGRAGFEERLRSFHFDVAIAYGRGATWREQAFALRLKIPNRVGYIYKGFSGLVTFPVPMAGLRPYPFYFRDLVTQIISEPAKPPDDLRPLVYPKPEDETAAAALAHRLGLDRSPEPILACAVTSRQPSGVWPPDKFLETVRWVRKRRPGPVVYIGAPGDRGVLERLAAMTGQEAVVVAGELALPATVCLLRRCAVALTSDSGLRHLAHAARIPVVFVRNLATREIEAGSYGPTDFDLTPPGIESLSRATDAEAFARIHPDLVGEKVLELLVQATKGGGAT